MTEKILQGDVFLKDLPAAAAVSEASVFAVDNGGETLERADGKTVTAGLLGDLSGAAVEAMATVSALKKLWSEKLHEKGADVSPTAPAVDFGNATDALDVHGSRQYWVGDFVGAPKTGTNLNFFFAVPNTNYIIEWGYGGGYAFHVYDMTGATSFPSARVLTSEPCSTVLYKTIGVSRNGKKIAYLKSKTEMVVLTVDYDAWTLTEQTYTLPSALEPYTYGPMHISDDGLHALVMGNNSSYVYGVNLDSLKVEQFYTNLWPNRSSVESIQFDAGNKIRILQTGSVITEFAVNWEAMTISKTRTYSLPLSFPMNVHYYAPAGLWYGVTNNSEVEAWNEQVLRIGLCFEASGEAVEIKLRLAPSVNRTCWYTCYDVFLRVLENGHLLFCCGAAGNIEFDLPSKKVVSPTAPDGCVLGNCFYADTSTETCYQAYADGNIYVGSPANYTAGGGGYAVYRNADYTQKIIGEFVVRNGTLTALRAPATAVLLKSGALDPKETTLELEEA